MRISELLRVIPSHDAARQGGVASFQVGVRSWLTLLVADS